MTSQPPPLNDRRLPGNDGSWFLEAVGLPASPALEDYAAAETTTEDVRQRWEENSHEAVATARAGTPGGARRPRSRTRWALIAIGVVAASSVVFALLWLPGTSQRRADGRMDDYARTTIELRGHLPEAQQVLATITEPGADATQFPELIPVVAAMRSDATDALELAGEPLPSAWFIAPNDPFDELAATRDALSGHATTADAIARRLSAVLDYRTIFAGFLDIGEPSTAPPDVDELAVSLATTTADAASILADLPDDAALVEHRAEAHAALERFRSWQVEYTDALRKGGDGAGLLFEHAAIRDELAQVMLTALAQIRTEIDGEIVDLAATLDTAIAAMAG